MASEFAINATDKESLMAAAKEAGYSTGEANSIAPAARSIAGVKDAEIVAWSYRSQEGEVSNPILTSDFYIVAHLDAITKAGAPDLEDVREKMVEGATNEAKGEFTPEKMTGSNLDDIAAAVSETVKTGRDVSIKFPHRPRQRCFCRARVAAWHSPHQPVRCLPPLSATTGLGHLSLKSVTDERQLLLKSKAHWLLGRARTSHSLC